MHVIFRQAVEAEDEENLLGFSKSFRRFGLKIGSEAEAPAAVRSWLLYVRHAACAVAGRT